MKKSGLLIIIAGPSGSGKSTVRQMILKNKSLKLVFSISLTTRKKRVGEKNGVDYYFVTLKEFKDAIKKHDLLEYNEYVNNYYGTSKKQVNKIIKEGKNVLLEIDINGAKNIYKSFDKKDILSFFIIAPSLKELEKRIRARSSENEEAIKKRLKRAKAELKFKGEFDYVIKNDDPKRAAQEITTLIKRTYASRG